MGDDAVEHGHYFIMLYEFSALARRDALVDRCDERIMMSAPKAFYPADGLVAFEKPAGLEVFVTQLDFFCQLATKSYKVFQRLLRQLIRRAVGLSGEMLKLFFQCGSKVDGHESTVG